MISYFIDWDEDMAGFRIVATHDKRNVDCGRYPCGTTIVRSGNLLLATHSVLVPRVISQETHAILVPCVINLETGEVGCVCFK